MINNKQVIFILKSFGNNLKNGRSIEQSLYQAILTLEGCESLKNEWIRQLNINSNVQIIFDSLSKKTQDRSLARVWFLVKNFVSISSRDAAEKILEITANLEKNMQLTEKRNSLLKAQGYKILFLGTITSVFLGIIAGLTPLFISFISIIRGISFSTLTLKLIPWSLYLIAILAAYFTTDFGPRKFTLKSFFISSLIYLLSFILSKMILLLIL